MAIGCAVSKAMRAHAAQIDLIDDRLFMGAPELVVALLADAENLDRLALLRERVGAIARQAHDRSVESAAKPALAGADHEQVRLARAAAGKQRRRLRALRDPAGEIGEHQLDFLGVGTRRLDRALRAAQLRHGDHLHGLGDLLRRLDGGDPVSQVL